VNRTALTDEEHAKLAARLMLYDVMAEELHRRLYPPPTNAERRFQVGWHRLKKFMRLTFQSGRSPARALYRWLYCGGHMYFVSELTEAQKARIDFEMAMDWEANA